MIILTEQAHKKDCPFTTYVANEGQQYDQNFAITEQRSCSGDRCMAWQPLRCTDKMGYCARCHPNGEPQ